jgi:putative membrane protein
MQLTAKDQKRIVAAIRAAEKKTSGEIYCVMASASSNYRFLAIARAAIVALAVPLPLFLFTSWWAEEIYLAQIAVFIVCAALFSVTPLRHRLIGGWIKRERASHEAKRQFAAHGLHLTKARTGVLIFVSVAERYAEVVADSGINARVPQETWDRAIAALIGGIKAGKAADGYVEAIGICGAVLAKHFPAGRRNKNELPDRLILI